MKHNPLLVVLCGFLALCSVGCDVLEFSPSSGRPGSVATLLTSHPNQVRSVRFRDKEATIRRRLSDSVEVQIPLRCLQVR